MRKQMKKMLAGILAGSMVLGACTTTWSANAATTTTTKKEVDLNGTYHAALGIKTCTIKWYNRMGYFYKDKAENPYYGDPSGKANRLQSTKDGEAAGVFTDTDIAGNGSYTVSLTDAEFNGEKHVAVLQVATDIPESDAIQFSDVSVNVNGKEVLKFDKGFKENEKSYTKGGMVLMLLNQWRMQKDESKDFAKVVSSYGFKKEEDRDVSDGGGYLLLNGTGKESISVTFTVSGFAYNKGDIVPTTPVPSATAAPGGQKKDPAVNTSQAAIKTDVTVAGSKYKIVNASTAKAAAVLVKAAQKSKITVPDTIKANGKNVKVTAVKAGAFKGNKKLTSVKLGKNVAKIEKNAFCNCKKLVRIDVKSDKVLNSVGSNALKGVNKKCKVLAPKSKLKKYQKLFKNKGQKVAVM